MRRGLHKKSEAMAELCQRTGIRKTELFFFCLSDETTASKNLDQLINRPHRGSFFSLATPANLLRDPPSLIALPLREWERGEKKNYNG